MATLATGQLTLADWSKRTGPDGKISPIAELLSQQNDVLEDVVFMQLTSLPATLSQFVLACRLFTGAPTTWVCRPANPPLHR